MNTAVSIFLDFDGTVTQTDTLYHLLNLFAPNEWWELEQEVFKEKISEFAALRAQMALIRVTESQAFEILDRDVRVDPGFPVLLAAAQERNYPVILLSGGFESIIRHTLQREKLEVSGIRANLAEVEREEWKVKGTPYRSRCPGCNHCKSASIVLAKAAGAITIFAGDGQTDRCPAWEADILFAKGRLADYCLENHLPFLPYEQLDAAAALLVPPVERLRESARQGLGANPFLTRYQVTRSQIAQDVSRSLPS